MKVQPQFPEHRLHDPKRRAELAAYRDLEASELPGIAVYSSRVGPASPEIDNSIWIPGHCRGVVEIKGGQYCRENEKWFLAGPGGRVARPNPLMQAYDAGMSLRNAIGERLPHRGKPYVICVTLFADMQRDEEIEACTAGGPSKVLWGTENIVGRLVELAREVGIKYPPSTTDAEEESALMVPSWDCRFPEPAHPAELGLDARQVVIQHVEHLHVYTSMPAPLAEGARMDRADRIQLVHQLLDRAETDRHTPTIGSLLAARWASGAIAHALMAYSDEAMTTEVPASMYAAAARLDLEDGGGERWTQAAYAAGEISRAFYSGRIADQLERETDLVVQAARELLDRLDATAT